MQISADAAALGGARKLAANADHAAVDAEIHQLAFANAADAVEWNYINNNRGVHVVASRRIPTYFATIYGHKVFTVTAEAEAQYEHVTGVDGLFPLTMDCNCPTDTNRIILVEGRGTVIRHRHLHPHRPPHRSQTVSIPPPLARLSLLSSQSSSYSIRYVGQTGNTWTYEISEVAA